MEMEVGQSQLDSSILLSLLGKGLITDIEFRIITCCKGTDKRVALVEVMLTKCPEKAVGIMEILQTLENDSKSVQIEEQHHPLLNKVVASYIFKFLPLKDIINCRLVCRQWNTTAEPILRAQATCHFDDVLQPATFIDAFQYCLPDIPFTAFKFSKTWLTSEIEEFFNKWGKNIKKVKFSGMQLKHFEEGEMLDHFDITPWIEKASNLVELDIYGCNLPYTILEIQFKKMATIKSLSLSSCTILLSECDNIPVSPVLQEINLDAMNFKQNGEFIIANLNLVFDFNEVVKIRLFEDYGTQSMEFDMGNHIFNAQSLCLTNIETFNWETARGKIDYLYIDNGHFTTKNGLQIRQLFTDECTIDLSALPKSIEKLHFRNTSDYEVTIIDLPLLENLCLEGEGGETNLEILLGFANCANLTKLELILSRDPFPVEINLEWLPKTVKRLKINCYVEMVDDENDDSFFELDTLILEDYMKCLHTDVVSILRKFKPKVLVVSGWDVVDLDTTEVVKFILENTHLEKIVVGTCYDVDLHSGSSFDTSVISLCVNEKSNYYVFEGRRGKAITSNEFENYKEMNGLDVDLPFKKAA